MNAPHEYKESSSLAEHMGYVREMVERSIRDPGVRRIAAKVVAGRFDWMEEPRTGQQVPVITEWGMHFHAPQLELCPQDDDLCEINAMWDFVKRNVRYVYDPVGADFFQTVRETLETGSADCDDYDILFAGLLGEIGFDVVARVISQRGAPEEWTHTYPMVGIPKGVSRGFLPLDATVPGKAPGWEYPKIARVADFPLT